MRYLAIPLVVGLMVFAACVSTTDTGDVAHDQTTVMGTLLLFEDLWNSGDVDAYEGLLDEDNFTFYFDPMDAERGLPESWGFDEEMTAYTNIFDAVEDQRVEVEVKLELEDVTEPDESAITYKVEDIPYEGQVYDEDRDRTYLFEGNLDMKLKKIDGLWIITDWCDFNHSYLLVEPTTWGVIKAEF